MDISKAISAIREGKGIKQIEIATMLGIEQSNYSRLEKRGNKLTVDQLQAISAALGVTVLDILMWGEVKSEPNKDDAVKEIQQLKKHVTELESRLYDKDFIIAVTKTLINNRLSNIFNDVVTVLKLGSVKYVDENDKLVNIPYTDIKSQSIPDDYVFELSESEQQQAYKQMFIRPEYSLEATFLVSTGFAEDEHMLQAFSKYALEQSLNRYVIGRSHFTSSNEIDNLKNHPLWDISRKIGYKEIIGTNKG